MEFFKLKKRDIEISPELFFFIIQNFMQELSYIASKFVTVFVHPRFSAACHHWVHKINQIQS